jgi:hypothetical protein
VFTSAAIRSTAWRGLRCGGISVMIVYAMALKLTPPCRALSCSCVSLMYCDADAQIAQPAGASALSVFHQSFDRDV